MQWRVLIATMIGYTLFYFMRKNFSFAMPGLEQDCGITKSELGNFLFAGGIVYGISKFLNGFVGDRVNSRKMLCFGLLACTVVNVAFGFVPDLASGKVMVWTFGALLVLNQFFQGTGFPPVCAADRVLGPAEGTGDEDVRLEHEPLNRRRPCREGLRRHHGAGHPRKREPRCRHVEVVLLGHGDSRRPWPCRDVVLPSRHP